MLAVQIEHEVMGRMLTNTGDSVLSLSLRQPIMLVFLRHFGCIFCREALDDISQNRALIESSGVKVVFVHMASEEVADPYFSRYNLGGAVHVSDPTCSFYTEFGLVKGNFTQLFGLKSWIRGFQAGVLDGHGAGAQLGDGFQMPGIFVIRDGKLVESFIHKLVSDCPDYIKLSECCSIEWYQFYGV